MIPHQPTLASSDSSSSYISTVQSVLAFKSHIPFTPTSYLLSLHRLMFLAASSCLQTRSEFFNGMLGLGARSTKFLRFLSSHPVDLFCIQESNLNSSSSFRIPGFCDLIAPTPGLAYSLPMTRTPVVASSFSSSRAYFSRNFLSPLSPLDPYPDYVGVIISLNTSRSHCLSHSLFALLYEYSSKNLFILRDFNCYHLLGYSKGTSDPRWEEVLNWVISNLLALNNPDIPTLHHCSSPDISFASYSLALFCSWEMFQDLGSDHLPILLTVPLSPQ